MKLWSVVKLAIVVGFLTPAFLFARDRFPDLSVVKTIFFAPALTLVLIADWLLPVSEPLDSFVLDHPFIAYGLVVVVSLGLWSWIASFVFRD